MMLSGRALGGTGEVEVGASGGSVGPNKDKRGARGTEGKQQQLGK